MNFEAFKELRAAMDFLENHPAVNSQFGGTFFTDNLSFGPDAFCKNGIPLSGSLPEDVMVMVKTDHLRFQEWSQRWPDEVDKLEDMRGNLINHHMHVPYEEVFGCKWDFCRTNYSGSFRVYRAESPSPDADFLPYEAVRYIVSPTFEQLVIDIAAWVKDNFGCFREEDFFTAEEKENNDKQEAFLFNETSEDIFEMKKNPNRIYVPWQSVNLRWWKWFETTDLYQRDYKSMLTQE